ncbi:MAG: (Fe-S)-binding protein [Nitrospirae bacterium]|nr:(Fe-S)-binding protein [Nitrospirota bacterium]
MNNAPEEGRGILRSAHDLDLCVRCGSCKAQCPTYGEDVTEGMSARGRVILLKKYIEGEIGPSEILDERIFSCMLCGACNTLCPLGINITDAVYEGRKSLRKSGKRRRFLGVAARLAFKRASTGFKVLKFLDGLGELLPVHKLPYFRTLHEMGVNITGPSLRDGTSLFKVARPRGRVAVFAGCTVNFLYPHIGSSLITILNSMNFDVVVPKGEVCCGAPLLGLGFEEDAAELAERNMKLFRKMSVEAIIGLCPTCVYFIRDEYRKLIGDGVKRAMDVTMFFSSEKPEIKKDMGQILSSVAYHDPCHAIYSLGLQAEPRAVLKSAGISPIDSEKGCCGLAGTFRILYPDMSKGLLEKKVESYKDAGMIVTSCPNCVLQLRSGIKGGNVKHIVEIIGEAVQGEKPKYGSS